MEIEDRPQRGSLQLRFRDASRYSRRLRHFYPASAHIARRELAAPSLPSVLVVVIADATNSRASPVGDPAWLPTSRRCDPGDPAQQAQALSCGGAPAAGPDARAVASVGSADVPAQHFALADQRQRPGHTVLRARS
jgi:hypothetical protein